MRIPRFRRLLGALATSQLGDWIYNYALLAFVYEVNHQAGFPRVASETGRDAISGTVEVRYGGLAAGSYLELPVHPRS